MKNKNYFKQLKELIPLAQNKLTNVFVTAIIVTDKGVFKGINYEHPICSFSLCAERVAIYSAIAKGMEHIYEIHLLPSIPKMTMCGACRQLALTFADKRTKVFVYNIKTGKRSEEYLGQLMPKATLLTKI